MADSSSLPLHTHPLATRGENLEGPLLLLVLLRGLVRGGVLHTLERCSATAAQLTLTSSPCTMAAPGVLNTSSEVSIQSTLHTLAHTQSLNKA